MSLLYLVTKSDVVCSSIFFTVSHSNKSEQDFLINVHLSSGGIPVILVPGIKLLLYTGRAVSEIKHKEGQMEQSHSSVV